MVGAEQIKKLRKITGLNQIDFGEKVGVGQCNLSLYENGKHQISLDTFLKWCSKCGVEFKILSE